MASCCKYLLWDFDGTLGYRPGQWSGAVVQVLRRFVGREVDIEKIRPFMRKGFPWHNPNQPMPPMRAAEDWWDALLPVFESAFLQCQLTPEQAKALARNVRSVYTDIAEWKLFAETRDVLSDLGEKGWRHAILSNHVPELPSLINGLGIGPLICQIVNSADTGFEKPHPRAFQAALEALENPGEVWMIGDNIEADVLGAESVGLRAILVRGSDPRAQRRADSLWDVQKFLSQPA
jgi:putative hydrolase of the HAD superfamily